jgi:rhodanese-related sulfurtransferase
MITRVDALEGRVVIERGVVVLDALPEATWRREHLPTARSVPLETFEPSTVDDLDRAEPVLVYCFDQHCDLSARLSRRLDELGFERVHDLIGGRAAWTALGLPTEGTVGDRRRISQFVEVVETLPLDGTMADLYELGEVQFPTPIVTDDGVLMGAIHPTAAGLPSDTALADVMVPAPGTIRPELRIEEVAEQLRSDGLDHVFVTKVDGTLIGLVVTSELHV